MDARDLQCRPQSMSICIESKTDELTGSRATSMFTDRDKNLILVDQHY